MGASARTANSTITTVVILPAPVLKVVSWARDHVTLVCRAPQSHQGVLFTLYRVTEQVESFVTPQGSAEAEFRLHTETVAPDPQQHPLYCCLYKNSLGIYSAFSPYLSLLEPKQPPAPPDLLPRPTLTLQQQEGMRHLSCRGSAAYPGSRFSLYRADSELLMATHQASMTSYQTAFPIPVQDQATVQYKCRYSALLGKQLGTSEWSRPLEVSQGLLSSVDWALVAGSFSAVVLFLAAVVLVVFVVHRKGRKLSSGAEVRAKIM
ncbi:unnamed protein product [Merluccius merluccius]